MTKTPQTEAAASPESIDAHSLELMKEFLQHYQELVTARESPPDMNIVFQEWVMQKISSLQLAVLYLADVMNKNAATSAILARDAGDRLFKTAEELSALELQQKQRRAQTPAQRRRDLQYVGAHQNSNGVAQAAEEKPPYPNEE